MPPPSPFIPPKNPKTVSFFAPMPPPILLPNPRYPDERVCAATSRVFASVDQKDSKLGPYDTTGWGP